MSPTAETFFLEAKSGAPLDALAKETRTTDEFCLSTLSTLAMSRRVSFAIPDAVRYCHLGSSSAFSILAFTATASVADFLFMSTTQVGV